MVEISTLFLLISSLFDLALFAKLFFVPNFYHRSSCSVKNGVLAQILSILHLGVREFFSPAHLLHMQRWFGKIQSFPFGFQPPTFHLISGILVDGAAIQNHTTVKIPRSRTRCECVFLFLKIPLLNLKMICSIYLGFFVFKIPCR